MLYKISTLIVLVVVPIALVLSIFCGWPSFLLLKVIICDVGQGDAILLQQGFRQILIDTGPSDQVLACLAKHMPYWDKTIEVIVATHADKDHVGGTVAVMENYSTKTVVLTSQSKQTDDFRAFKEALQRQERAGTYLLYPELGDVLLISNEMFFQVINPLLSSSKETFRATSHSETILSDTKEENQEKSDDYNNRSIGLFLQYKDVSILLTGDMEEQAEQAMIEDGLTETITLLKVGHHGAKTSSKPYFLERLRPEISAISAGIDNNYNHPHPETISNLEEIGSQVIRTDREGDLVLETDGINLWQAPQNK